MFVEEKDLLDNKMARACQATTRETSAIFVKRIKAAEVKVLLLDQAT